MSERSVTLGQLLQATRGTKGLSAQKAADELHLDGWVIEGLESGNYERIGPAVYAKGHLKRYAELLGLPVADVLADFDGSPATIPPPTQPAGMRMRTAAPAGSDLPWPAIVGCAGAALMLAGVLWWRPWHARRPAAAPAMAADSAAPGDAASGAAPAGQTPGVPGSTTTSTTTSATTSATGSPAASSAAGPGVGAGALPAAAATPGAVGATGAAAAAGAADPPAAAGRARLRLSFLADSWVDVRDASGQRLYAGNGHVNNVRSMSGEAPFRVYLKSASSIRMEINNHVVAIGPQFVVADVAHFEAGADGVLRRDLHAAPKK